MHTFCTASQGQIPNRLGEENYVFIFRNIITAKGLRQEIRKKGKGMKPAGGSSGFVFTCIREYSIRLSVRDPRKYRWRVLCRGVDYLTLSRNGGRGSGNRCDRQQIWVASGDQQES